MTDVENIYSEEYYSKRRTGLWREDAKEISKCIHKYIRPNSVIDFGCAIGTHLMYFYNNGVVVKGVDGHPASKEHSIIPEERIEIHDLREPYKIERQYNLCLCIETAEHIAEEYSNTLIDTLTQSSNLILFSAARPNQGGTHHVNEQPKKYWQMKFERRNFYRETELESDIKTCFTLQATTNIEENIMCFKHKR